MDDVSRDVSSPVISLKSGVVRLGWIGGSSLLSEHISCHLFYHLFCHVRAEDAVDKIIAVTPTISAETLSPCRTLSTHLVGFDGYSVNLPIRLVQDYGISIGVARHLVDSYAGRTEEVLSIAKELAGNRAGDSMHRHAGRCDLEVLLAPGFPIIEAEVIFAARFDWAVRAEDFLARRTRLAFLNKDAAIVAIPRVVQLMGEELRWTSERQQEEVVSCLLFMRHFGGK